MKCLSRATHSIFHHKNSIVQISCRRVLSAATQNKALESDKPPNNDDMVFLFRNLFPWKTDREMASFLAKECITYRDDEVLAINKPYGLGMHQRLTSSKNIVQTANTSLCSSYQGDLTRVLPHLAKELGVDELWHVKSAERYNSGVCLLATSQGVKEKMLKYYARVSSVKMQREKYLAITIGSPSISENLTTIGIELQKNKNDMKQPVIVNAASKTSIAEGRGKMVSVQHKTLSSNPSIEASLVSVSTSSTKWHFVRVYLSYLLSPILGDHIKGSRVSFSGPSPHAVNPFSHLAQLPQEPPVAILQALGVKRGQQILIPVCLHLSQMTLPGWGDKNKKDLILTAQRPHYFDNILRKLGLDSS